MEGLVKCSLKRSVYWLYKAHKKQDTYLAPSRVTDLVKDNLTGQGTEGFCLKFPQTASVSKM